jgi:regulator of protease activity HflC (stomatin/prohibitin superfamily)
MATLSSLLWFRHLRADPNEHVLLFRAGRLAQQGRGLAAWFYPLSTSIALVPVEDSQTTFIITERTSDLQSLAVQCTVTFRFANAEQAAARSNFSISLITGRWIESPLERIAGFLAQRVRGPVRTQLMRLPLPEAVRTGADSFRTTVMAALASDQEVVAMGIAIVDFQVENIAPSPDIAKALEAPTREAVQQKADEAVFQRRALAVEKEQAIKENELNTQIELARRQDELIRRKNANEELAVQGKAAADRLRVTSETELARLTAEGAARDARIRAEAEAQSRQILGEADAKAQGARAAAWRDVPPHVLTGLAAHDLAAKIDSIKSVTITPDGLTDLITRLTARKDS